MDLPDCTLSPYIAGKTKSITANDVICSDVKHKESIFFNPTSRLLFGSDTLVRTELPVPAFYDRLLVIPFLYPVPKNKQDHILEEKLVTEASEICLKTMEYYKKLRSRGNVFTEIKLPDGLDASINHATVIRQFTNDFCELTRNTDDKVEKKKIKLNESSLNGFIGVKLKGGFL
jgi:putative DNA primase/helicase